MSAYIVKQGDTFESISRLTSGVADNARLIRTANPGSLPEPLPGSTLFLPQNIQPIQPKNAGVGDLTVVIDGTEFIGWLGVSFSRSMDSFGSFNLSAVWEPQNKLFRDLFRPFSYHDVAIFEGSELLFNGTMLNISPQQNPTSRTVVASGYSRPGVVNDCTAPVTLLPLEVDNFNILQIATELLKPFGVPVESSVDVGPLFQREAISSTDKIFDFLIRLAQQKNLIITDTPQGACKFQTEVDTGHPVATLTEGEPGIVSTTPQFNPQGYYSHVSGQSFTAFGAVDNAPGAFYTVQNQRLQGVLRPLTFSAPDTDTGGVKTATEAKMGRMFANAVRYDVIVPSWRDPTGNLWKPNTTIELTAPGAMIYNLYEFLIREVIYTRNDREEFVRLVLTLPGSLRGEIPKTLPWDE